MKKTFTIMLFTACVMFTAMMIISLAFAYGFSGPSYGLNLSLSMLVACIAAAALQGLWFSGTFIKRLNYTVRMGGFVFTLAPSLYACGWFGGWFPQSVEAALVFFALFIAIFAVIALSYHIYFKRTAGSYEKALAKYREEQAADAASRQAR